MTAYIYKMTWQETIPGEIYFVSTDDEDGLQGTFAKYTVSEHQENMVDVMLAGPSRQSEVKEVSLSHDAVKLIKVRRVTKIELAKAKLYGL